MARRTGHPLYTVDGVTIADTSQTVSGESTDTAPVPTRSEATTVETLLATDFTSYTSPGPKVLLSGSFVANASRVTLEIQVVGSQRDALAANASFQFYYASAATVPTGPLAQKSQGAQRTGVTMLNVGAINSYPGQVSWSKRLSGLTVGATYRWDLTATIVGYADSVALPDAPLAVDVSDAVNVTTLASREFGDRIVAVVSATKLHLVQSNHTGNLSNKLRTGAGYALTASRSFGNVAVTPDGLRCLVAHYGVNKASVLDITTLATPTVVGGADLNTLTAPLAVAINPAGTIGVLADYAQTPTRLQRITTLNATPALQASFQLDAAAAGITKMDFTPDGTKLLVAGGLAKVWKVDPTTQAVTAVATPSAKLAYQVCALSNTKALVAMGSNELAIWNLSTDTFSTVVSNAAWTSVQRLAPFGDGAHALLVRSTSLAQESQVILPDALGDTNPESYVVFGQTATGVDGVNDNRGNIWLATSSPNMLYVWFGAEFFCRPSLGGFYSEQAAVRVTPASA